jgi:hypothetical protein
LPSGDIERAIEDVRDGILNSLEVEVKSSRSWVE